MPLPEDRQHHAPHRPRRAAESAVPDDTPYRARHAATDAQRAAPRVTPAEAARRAVSRPQPDPAVPGAPVPQGPKPAVTGATSAPSTASRAAAPSRPKRPSPQDDVRPTPAAARGATSAPARFTPAKPAGDRAFRGAITRTVAGTFLPGLGLLGTWAHWVGVVILALFVGGVIGLAAVFGRNPALAAGSALQSDWMLTIAIVLAVLAIGWVTVIAGTYLVSRPRNLTNTQRRIGAAVVAAMSLLISAPLGVASAYSFETAGLSGDLFQPEKESQSQTRPTLDVRDPWADKARVNILLLGGDSGESRDVDLGVRTDTMMLASIDTASGNTVIIQLPRNLQYAQFPAGSQVAEYFPYGFDNGADSMLNAVWHDVPAMYPELFPSTDYPGADALKWAVEGTTGQRVDYFVMVNIDGLVQLVDAMGGVTLNVNFPIAKGGSDTDGNCGEWGWIPEGPDRHLGGDDAMWYARSRCNTPTADFGRMQRQSCLVNAVIDQADPAKMAVRYEAIAKATGEMVSTDIPQEHLSPMVELATRVQGSGQVSRLAFVNGEDGFWSESPDFDLMKARVNAAIAASVQTASPAPASSDAPPATGPAQPAPATEPPAAQAPTTVDPQPGGQPAPGDATTTTPPAENVADACAYRHEEPAGWIQVPETVPVYTPPASESPR